MYKLYKSGICFHPLRKSLDVEVKKDIVVSMRRHYSDCKIMVPKIWDALLSCQEWGKKYNKGQTVHLLSIFKFH